MAGGAVGVEQYRALAKGGAVGRLAGVPHFEPPQHIVAIDVHDAVGVGGGSAPFRPAAQAVH